jgi:hypothetical protein
MSAQIQISMKRKALYSILLFAIFFVTFGFWNLPVAHAQEPNPPVLEPTLSVDGLTAYNAVPPLVLVDDPNPAMRGIKIPDTDRGLCCSRGNR